MIAAEDAAVVTAHLIGDTPFRGALPAARRDVDVLIVKEHPHFGALLRVTSVDRLVLHEVGEGHRRAVELLIELTIETQGARQPYGVDQRSSLGVTSDGRIGGRLALS